MKKIRIRTRFWTFVIDSMKSKVAFLLIICLGHKENGHIDGCDIRAIEDTIKFHVSLDDVTNERIYWPSMHMSINNKESKKIFATN